MKTTKHIDWRAVYQQLETGRQALEDALNPTPEKTAQKLRQRAQKLRQRTQTKNTSHTQTPFLSVHLCNENYAVPLNDILEIQPFEACTPLPGAPAACLGITNHRGRLKPVFSLARLLSISEKTSAPDSHLLFLRTHKLGLKVDRATEIHTISEDQWQPPQAGNASSIVGIGPHHLIRLDLNRLLKGVVNEPFHR